MLVFICVKLLLLVTQLLRKFARSRWDVRHDLLLTAAQISKFSFLAPPVMLVSPQDQRSRDPGVTVVFTADIIGEPRPVITWYHGNQTVVFNDTRFVIV